MQMFADVRLLMETECYTYLQSMNNLGLPRESIESLMTSPIWVSKGWPCHENGLFFVWSGTGSRIAGFIGIVWKSRSHDRAKTLAVTKFVINHRFESCDGQHNFFLWVRYNASNSTMYRIGQIMSLLDNNVTFYTPSTHTFSSHPKEKNWHKTQLNCCIETKYRIMNSLYWCLHYLMTVTKGFLKVMETKMEHFGIKL